MKSIILALVSVMGGWQQSSFAQDGKRTITILEYNAENLFDTEHDQNKDDYEFIPKSNPLKAAGCAAEGSYAKQCASSDWTPERLNMKLDNLARVILAKGSPDVIILEEIENYNVLQMLAHKVGYTGIILNDGPDQRGIDVGVLYKEGNLKYVSNLSRPMTGPEFATKPTRDLLTVYFQINGLPNAVLAVNGNHWPSQGAPTSKRLATEKLVKQYIQDDVNKYGKNLYVVCAGDFNVIEGETPNPLTELASNNFLSDARDLARAAGVDLTSMPAGTYFFPPQMSWNVLDHIFVSPNLSAQDSSLKLDATSYKILGYDFASKPQNLKSTGQTIMIPKGLNVSGNTNEDLGFSDHYPVTVNLKY